MNVRSIQIVCALLGLIPVATGLFGLVVGASDPLYSQGPRDVLLDSNLRFFSGVWLGLGIALFWTLPRIGEQTVLFRVIWGMIFVGGMGRLISMAVLAVPPAPFIAFTALEIIGAPLIVWWQSRVAKDKP